MIKKTALKVGGNQLTLFRLIDLTLLLLGFYLIDIVTQPDLFESHGIILMSVLASFLFVSNSFPLYLPLRAGEFRKRLMTIFIVVTVSFWLVIVVLFFLKESETYSRLLIGGWGLLTLVLLMGWRVAFRFYKHLMRQQGLLTKRVAIIGATPHARELMREFVLHPELGLKCIGIFDDRLAERLVGFEYDQEKLLGNVQKVIELAQQNEVDQVYICLPLLAEKRIADLIRRLGDTTVDVYMMPDFLIKNLMHGTVSHIGAMERISVFERPMVGVNDFYKRLFDVVFSICVLLCLSPLLLTIALVIKWDSKGPVLFRQDRYGLDGKSIGVFKFRSMTVMENAGVVTQATKNDRRITKVGAFLRKTSLDELPQFVNVLLGDMSVVGPRPHAVAHNEEYRKRVDYYMLRHKVKPGITGWAQINGWRGETDTLEKMEMRVKYDLDYIRNWSLWWDIKIVWLTLFKGFMDKNAY